MPRKKRMKPSLFVTNLHGSLNSKTKIKHSNHHKKSNIKKSHSNAKNVYSLCDELIKHLALFLFIGLLILCIITSYYLYIYFNKLFYHNSNILTLLLYILSILLSSTIYSYLFSLSALLFAPHGYDQNSSKIGESLFNPRRVYAFMCTMCQQLSLIFYAYSYYYNINSYLIKCAKISIDHDTDLNTLTYEDISHSLLKDIIYKSNNKTLRVIHQQNNFIKSELTHLHYDNTICHNPHDIKQYAQIHESEMISILNVHYDHNDSSQYANIFLPSSYAFNNKQYRGQTTPVIIFLVGGAWGSCDMTFSASVASSFIKNKITFIYPKYATFQTNKQQITVNNMLSNINAIIKWTIKYSKILNINPNHITIIGQSSGAHLSSLSIMKAYKNKSKWLKYIRLFIGLSGPYDISDHYKHESGRGIEHISPMGRCMKGKSNFVFYSPSSIASRMFHRIKTQYYANDIEFNKKLNTLCNTFPSFVLIHSINDYVVPISSSIKYSNYLKQLNIKCELLEYQKGTHYDTLFGLCDINNVLFNQLITDITSRIFNICKQYKINQNTAADIVDTKQDLLESESSITSTDSSTDSSDSSSTIESDHDHNIDDKIINILPNTQSKSQQNDQNITDGPVTVAVADKIVGNDDNNDVDEIEEEEYNDDEKQIQEPQKSQIAKLHNDPSPHNRRRNAMIASELKPMISIIRDEIKQNILKYEENDDDDDDDNDDNSNTTNDLVTHETDLYSLESTDESVSDLTEEDDDLFSSNDEIDTTNNDKLFYYADISIINDNDEIEKFMKNLVSDMNHALGQLSEFNTKDNIDIMKNDL